MGYAKLLPNGGIMLKVCGLGSFNENCIFIVVKKLMCPIVLKSDSVTIYISQ